MIVSKYQYGWEFTDKNDASFTMLNPVKNSRMYLPLCNNRLKSYVTPEMKGDILLNYDKYLTIPKSTEDLHHCKDGRSFWLNISGKGVFSCSGNSAENNLKAALGQDNEEVRIDAGIGWIRISRTSPEYSVKAENTIFVPSNDDTAELVRLTVTNIGDEPISFDTFYAVALYGRSTSNLRDHRDVSTLCNRLVPNPYGVILHPIMIHDEKKAYQNKTRYCVLGYDQDGKRAAGGWGRMYDFIGENGSMEAPEAVYLNKSPVRFEDMDTTGEEAVGAVKFETFMLRPGESRSFIIIQGITDDPEDIEKWVARYGCLKKYDDSLEETKQFWQSYVNNVEFCFADTKLNKFLKWVNFQPFLRKVYGSSYLPDFGYGTGKRYWRELWQDLLAIIIADPYSAKKDIMNNYNGVKLDGSNATLVGDEPGEFAHRSGLGRTWSDHGVWPYFTTRLYMDLTGDISILLEKAPYFKDHITRRGKGTDKTWTPEYGLRQRKNDGEIYYGTVLEHILVQNLTSFFNVGVHNLTLLEAGDWDDTMDMARSNGETVQFTAFYAANLKGICECLQKLKEKGYSHIEVAEEMIPLFDTLPGNDKVDYSDYTQKQGRLRMYYDKLDKGISGKTVKISIEELINDLTAKADFAFDLVNSQEYITDGEGYYFYNAYYTETCERLGGLNSSGGVNISLTPQAYLMVLGLTDQKRAAEIHKSVNRYLRNEFGGYILRSDHGDYGLIDIMGRGFGLAFKTRENGGQYNHMAVKYMNGLYNNNLVREGYEVFSTLTGLCMNSEVSRIFPGVPASIDSKSARGSYNYLTGSGSWLIFSIITEIIGIKPKFGELYIEPKLVREQFGVDKTVEACFIYLGKRTKITIKNEEALDWGEYRLGQARFNGVVICEDNYGENREKVRIPTEYLNTGNEEINHIEIELVRI